VRILVVILYHSVIIPFNVYEENIFDIVTLPRVYSVVVIVLMYVALENLLYKLTTKAL
jgi:hypothetical protein